MVSAAVDVGQCYACGETKPVDEFYRDSAKASGRMARCKACDLAKCRTYYAANREKILARYEPAPPRDSKCEGCGETFIATNGRQVYCKPGCRPTVDRGAKVEAVCDNCGREFVARARDRKRGGGRYCRKSCALRDRGRPEQDGGGMTPRNAVCASCGSAFKARWGRFCSKRCALSHARKRAAV